MPDRLTKRERSSPAKRPCARTRTRPIALVLVHHQPPREPGGAGVPVFLIARDFGLRHIHSALILMYLTFSFRPSSGSAPTGSGRSPTTSTRRPCSKVQASGHLPLDLPSARHARGCGLGDPIVHLLVERASLRLHPCAKGRIRGRRWR